MTELCPSIDKRDVSQQRRGECSNISNYPECLSSVILQLSQKRTNKQSLALLLNITGQFIS